MGEYVLSSYSLSIQRKTNRSQAIRGWASKCLDRMVAKTYKDYDAMLKYEIRRASVAINDEYAKRLYEIISEQDMILDDLGYLSQSVNNISNSLGNLARIRSKKYGFTVREN